MKSFVIISTIVLTFFNVAYIIGHGTVFGITIYIWPNWIFNLCRSMAQYLNIVAILFSLFYDFDCNCGYIELKDYEYELIDNAKGNIPSRLI